MDIIKKESLGTIPSDSFVYMSCLYGYQTSDRLTLKYHT